MHEKIFKTNFDPFTAYENAIKQIRRYFRALVMVYASISDKHRIYDLLSKN